MSENETKTSSPPQYQRDAALKMAVTQELADTQRNFLIKMTEELTEMWNELHKGSDPRQLELPLKYAD